MFPFSGQVIAILYQTTQKATINGSEVAVVYKR